MPLKIHCPKCQKALDVPLELAGRRGKCPACRESFSITPSQVSNVPPETHDPSLLVLELQLPDQARIEASQGAQAHEVTDSKAHANLVGNQLDSETFNAIRQLDAEIAASRNADPVRSDESIADRGKRIALEAKRKLVIEGLLSKVKKVLRELDEKLRAAPEFTTAESIADELRQVKQAESKLETLLAEVNGLSRKNPWIKKRVVAAIATQPLSRKSHLWPSNLIRRRWFGLGLGAAIAVVCFLICPMQKQPEDIVRAYLGAKSWQERLKFVLNPEQMRPLMAEHYAGVVFGATYLSISPEAMERPDLRLFNVVLGKVKNPFGMERDVSNKIFLRLVEGEWKIDWKATVCYSQMTLRLFKNLRPTKPVEFRVGARLSDFYFLHLENTHWCIDVTVRQPDLSVDSIRAYVKKSTNAGQRIFERLKAAKGSEYLAMMVTMRYPANSSSGDDCFIESFIKDSWLDDLDSMQSVREAARQAQCTNNLKQIALGMQEYADVYNAFPPAYMVDADGKPMHSWRVLILPYIEQKALYDRYNFDEPWDGPNNSQLAALMPTIYACPSNATEPGSTTTAYAVINGKGAVFDGDRPCPMKPLSAIRDGSSNTLLVVEASGAKIHWMEPRDLDFSKMQFVINGPGGNEIASHHPSTVNVAFADGYVRTLASELSPIFLRGMITREGLEPSFELEER